MKQGVLAHIYGQLPLTELAAKVSGGEFTSVQLALAKAISDIDTSNGRLSPGLANHIAEQFDRQDVRIAVLGCYIDPVHPDLSERRYGIERFKEHLRYARDFGCSMVATETGGYTTYQAAEPERYPQIGWSILKETMSELAEEADKWGVHMAIEPVADHTLHSTDLMLQLIEDIPTTAIGMLFDPCNMMKIEHLENQEAFLRDTFEKLADRMLLIHAKDFTFAPDGSKPYRTAGTGILDYPLFFRLLKQYKPHIDISLEGVPLEDLPQASLYMRQIWQDVHA